MPEDEILETFGPEEDAPETAGREKGSEAHGRQ